MARGLEKYAPPVNVIVCRTSQQDGGQVKFFFSFSSVWASCKIFLAPMQK
jgi:hypothetical protein